MVVTADEASDSVNAATNEFQRQTQISHKRLGIRTQCICMHFTGAMALQHKFPIGFVPNDGPGTFLKFSLRPATGDRDCHGDRRP